MEPFERVVLDEDALRSKVSDAVRGFPSLGVEQDDYDDLVKRYCKDEVWINDKYQVDVNREIKTPGWPEMVHLSIKLITEEPIHDWRDLQTIKNILVGEENEAIELYPAESRLVDMANRFHLWVIATPGIKFPFGFPDRITASEAMGDEKQRPIK
jgi:hypothetical protein